MIVRIKTVHAELPQYQTPGAVGFDFMSAAEITIAPKAWALIDTGTVIATPEGYMLQVQPRSSTFKNFGIMQVNSVGIIDQDYCGDGDTLKFAYMNMRDESVTIPAGTRIGQGVFVKIEQAQFQRVDTMWSRDRGGFGTTGNG